MSYRSEWTRNELTSPGFGVGMIEEGMLEVGLGPSGADLDNDPKSRKRCGVQAVNSKWNLRG